MSLKVVEEAMRLEDRYHLDVYKRYRLVVERGEDVWVHTSDGERYLDLYGGHAVCALGHCEPRVVDAVRRQMGRLIFYSNLVYNPVRASAAAKLVEAAPPGLDKVFFINSGAEANENALKLARMTSGRAGIISFHGSFHGRTAGALSATGISKMRESARPNVPEHHFAHFGDLEAARGLLEGGEIAGVILEPIQSMGGVQSGAPEFYRGLRQACDEAGTLLIYDEVQTGFGRTGEFFFAPRHGVTPDMITLAKGIAGGLPMGALLCGEEVSSKVQHGDLGSTFGGGPVACAALQATIESILERGLLENVRRQSAYLRSRLEEMPAVERVLGLGFLLGIEFQGGAAPAIKEKLFNHKILTGLSSDPKILRLLPPLTLQRPEIDHFLEALGRICEGMRL